MTFRRWSWLAAAAQRRGVIIVFILLVASMFATTSTFGSYQNLINVLQQNSIIGIIACGMTFALLHAAHGFHHAERIERVVKGMGRRELRADFPRTDHDF